MHVLSGEKVSADTASVLERRLQRSAHITHAPQTRRPTVNSTVLITDMELVDPVTRRDGRVTTRSLVTHRDARHRHTLIGCSKIRTLGAQRLLNTLHMYFQWGYLHGGSRTPVQLVCLTQVMSASFRVAKCRSRFSKVKSSTGLNIFIILEATNGHSS